REHERDLLFEHQRARRNRRHDIPALIDPARELWNVVVLVLLHRLEVADLELRHSATALLARNRDRDPVVLEDRNEIFAERGLVAVAVARREHHDAAFRILARLRLQLGMLPRAMALAIRVAVI